MNDDKDYIIIQDNSDYFEYKWFMFRGSQNEMLKKLIDLVKQDAKDMEIENMLYTVPNNIDDVEYSASEKIWNIELPDPDHDMTYMYIAKAVEDITSLDKN